MKNWRVELASATVGLNSVIRTWSLSISCPCFLLYWLHSQASFNYMVAANTGRVLFFCFKSSRKENSLILLPCPPKSWLTFHWFWWDHLPSSLWYQQDWCPDWPPVTVLRAGEPSPCWQGKEEKCLLFQKKGEWILDVKSNNNRKYISLHLHTVLFKVIYIG